MPDVSAVTARRDVVRTGVPAPAGMSLRRNFLWTVVGNLIYAACQWGMLAMLAKLGSPEWVGQFALGLALTAPVLLLTNLQLRAVQATDAGDEFEFGHYLALRLTTVGCAAVVIFGIILVSGLNSGAALVTAAVGLAKIVEAISDAFHGLLQKHERMDRIARSMILKGVLSLAAFGATIYVTHSVFRATLAMAAAWLCVLLWYDLRSVRRVLRVKFRPVWSLPKMRTLVIIAAPLGVVMMLNSLNVNIPRYALEFLSGTREVGIFAALAYLQIGEGAIINALGQSATPRLARGFAGREHGAYWSLLKRLLAVGTVAGGLGVFVAVVAGPAILTILYRAEYAAYNDAFVWLMAGTVFANIAAFAGYGLTAARSFRAQIPLLLWESVIMGVTCWLLIPKFGLVGAAVAYLIAKVFLMLSSLLLLRRTSHAHNLRHPEPDVMPYEK